MVNETLLELPGDLVEVDVGVARVVGDAEEDDVAVEVEVVGLQDALQEVEALVAPRLSRGERGFRNCPKSIFVELDTITMCQAKGTLLFCVVVMNKILIR